MLNDNIKTSYFYKAFAADVMLEWKGIERIAKNDYEIENLCYYRSLVSFIKKDLQSVKQRRKLLYSYLSKEFEAEKTTSTINRFSDTLPVETLAHLILGEICNAYKSSVRRTFTDIESVNQELTSIYEKSDLDRQLNEAYLIAKMCGVMLIRPVLIGETIKLFTYTPDKFRVKQDENGIIESVIYPTLNGEDIAYHQWTAESIRVIDAKGKIIEEFENYYKVLPFVVFKFDQSNEFYKAGEWTLVEEQLSINKMRFLADTNAVFNGSPIKFGTNLGTANIEISPDKIVVVNDVMVGEGLPVPPSLEFISPDIQYANINDYAVTKEKALKKKYGFPNSMVEDQSGIITSGISRVIERQSLIERRQADIASLNKLEQDLLEKIILILNYDGAKNYTVPDQLSIDYEEERIYNEPEVEYNFDKIKTIDGVMDTKQFLQKWSGIDTAITTDELTLLIQERKQLVDLLGIKPVETNQTLINGN